MQIDKDSTVGDIVTKDFRAARIFANYNIDFCCGGKKTLSEACSAGNAEIEAVIDELSKLGKVSGNDTRFENWGADFLVDYIVNNHHAYINRSIPLIEMHLEKVSEKHGAAHPEVLKLNGLFGEVKEELLSHMMKEEKMLFPYIKNLQLAEKGGFKVHHAPFGNVENPIRVMEMEHQKAGNVLKAISDVTNNYKAPDDACNTYKVLYQELDEFEKDLHVHIHLENNILFPKAIELENNLTKNNNE